MISLRRGIVREVLHERAGAQFLQVELTEVLAEAVCFPPMTGSCSPGDEVLLNTTAVELGLGTGGKHFVVANLSHPERHSSARGHIMKLRYTPMQVRVLAGGESESPHRANLDEGASLDGRPVVILPLHSMLPAAAIAFAETASHAPLAYLMTDAAALPIAFSDIVARLKAAGLITTTVTCGHAFGGDVEAVGLFDGLLLAGALAGNGAVVVAPGPGIVGTGTTFGTTALEQGQVVNAVASLRGTAIVAPRVSFADERARHRGLSHHTVTALTVAALALPLVALPQGYPDLAKEVKCKLLRPRDDGRGGLTEDHLRIVDTSAMPQWLKSYGLQPESMGRTPEDDPVLFEAAAAAGIVAAKMLTKTDSNRTCGRRPCAD